MNSSIIELWEQRRLPTRSALSFADGTAIPLAIVESPILTLTKGAAFGMNQFFEQNPDDLTCIEIFKTLPLRHDGSCCVGEGSHGSEGFVACLDEAQSLRWVIYLDHSNPFDDIDEVAAGTIVALSTAGLALRVDVENPLAMSLIRQPRW